MAEGRPGSKSVTLFLILPYLLSYYVKASSQNLQNVHCNLHIGVVQVDPANNKYPYFVKLHRCNGSIGMINPDFKKCGAKTEENITINVRDVSTGEQTQLQLKNHTSCHPTCTKSKIDCNKYETWDESLCACRCNTAQPTCEAPFKWNPHRCNCECPTRKSCEHERKEWNSETCGCTCTKRYLNRCAKNKKILDEDTCNCVKPAVAGTGKQTGECVGSVKQSYIILIVVGEFLVLLIVFSLFQRFCLQRKDSKFNTLRGSLRRKLSKKYKQEANTTENNTNHQEAVAVTESRISLEPSGQKFSLLQPGEKNVSNDPVIGLDNKAMDVDEPKRASTPTNFSTFHVNTSERKLLGRY